MTRAVPSTAILLLVLTLPAAAQQPADGPAPRLAPLTTIGSLADQRIRDAQLFGAAPPTTALLRSPSTLAPPLEGPGPRWQLLAPRIDLTWNSDLPVSFNDGAAWAGRGVTVGALAGVRASWGPISVVAAPELVHIQNLDTFVLPSEAEDRSAFASPWHSGAFGTADLPIRFGNEPLTVVLPGQSSVTLSAVGFAVGAATENQWWGPGIRNAIVLSNNAPGFPHAFVRSSHPWRTPVGDFEWKWIAGVLTESVYFDTVAANDNRAISAFAAAYTPAFEPNLTVGVARSVVRPIERWEDFLSHAGAAIGRWQAPDSTSTGSTLLPGSGSDQILSLFARYLLPVDGLEVYGEWARLDLPTSVRDLLTLTNHSRGYTIGMQYLGGTPASPGFRFQVEATSLEKSPAARQRPAPTFYLGGTTEQGYTHRGQVLGAAIGPGASSQWVAVDRYFDRGAWSIGAFGGRIRWENDTFFTRPLITRYDHDVSVFAGARSTARSRFGDVQAEVSVSRRYNYLFQHRIAHPVRPREAMDVNSVTFRLSVAPS